MYTYIYVYIYMYMIMYDKLYIDYFLIFSCQSLID